MSSNIKWPHISSVNIRTGMLTTIIGAMLTGCGGGGSASDAAGTPSANPSANESRVSALAIPVSTGLILDAGRALVPPTIENVNTYTSSNPYSGTAHYIDSANGNDSNDGGKNAPWKTLGKIISLGAVSPGDAVFLKCGGLWREQITELKISNILIDAYAASGESCTNSNRPIIRASYWINNVGWTQQSGSNILETLIPYNATTGYTAITRLFQSGKPLIKARHPNVNASGEPQFLTTDPLGTASKIALKVRANEFTYFKNKALNNATIYIRTQPFIVETAKINSYNEDTGIITLTTPLYYEIKGSVGYILEGQKWMLDTEREWFADEIAAGSPRKLYYWAPVANNTPNTSDLEATRHSLGIRTYQAPGFRIERIRFEQQEYHSLIVDSSDNAIIRDIESTYAFSDGIQVNNSRNATVQKSRVQGAGLYGIRANASENAIVIGNYIVDTGLTRTGAIERVADAQSSGIRLSLANANSAESNYIYQSSYKGIHFDNLPGVKIQKNTIVNMCLRLADCGGIYTSTNAQVPSPTTEAQMAEKGLIDQNIISSTFNNTKYGTVGIYLDDLSTGVTARNNIISNVNTGIYIHDGAYNTIELNDVRNVADASLMVGLDPGQVDIIRGNKVRNNTFVSHRTVNQNAFNLTPLTSIDGNDTYAELWVHNAAASQFFLDSTQGVRNISENNKVLTFSNINASNWRMNGYGKMSRYNGAVWGLRDNNIESTPYQALGIAEWLTTSSGGTVVAQPDYQDNPVSFKPYAVTALTGSLIQNGAFVKTAPLVTNSGTWGRTIVASDGSWGAFFDPRGGNVGAFDLGTLSEAQCSGSTCARLVAGHDADYLSSSAFAINGAAPDNLYLLSYKVTAGNSGGAHRVYIRQKNSPWSMVGLYIPPFTLAPNESRTIEQFFKGSQTEANAELALRASNGTGGGYDKDLYFSNVSLKRVNVPTVLPALNTLSINVLNASGDNVSFGCAQLGIVSGDCNFVVDDAGNSVGWPMTVESRKARQIYIKKPAWVQ